MTVVNGKVNNVWTVQAGSFLAQDAAIGDPILYVVDAYPFSESGGVLRLNGISRSYTAVDYEANTLTLLATMNATAVAEDQVLVWPYGNVKYAMVELADDDEGVRAIVPFAVSAMLPTGMRDAASLTQESVLITDEAGRWEVKSLDEEVPLIVATGFATGNPGEGPYLEISDDQVSYAYMKIHGDGTEYAPAQIVGQLSSAAASSSIDSGMATSSGGYSEIVMSAGPTSADTDAGNYITVTTDGHIDLNGRVNIVGQPTIRRTNAASGMAVPHATDYGVLFGTNIVTGPHVTLGGGTLPTGHTFTFTDAGLWLIHASVQWDNTVTTGRRQISVVSLGVSGTHQAKSVIDGSAIPVAGTHAITYLYQANAGDGFKIGCWQNSGSTVNINQDGVSTFLNAYKLA